MPTTLQSSKNSYRSSTMINEWMHFFWTQTLIFSALLLAIFALRPAVRTAFGSRTTYLLWLILPLAFAAQLIPVQPQEAMFAPILANETMLKSLNVTAAPDKFSPLSILFYIWVAGVIAVAGYFSFQHLVFLRAIGRLHPQDGYFTPEAQDIGPVLIGLWRPKIIMPLHFERNFSEHEKILMLAHEQTHQQRRDPVCNLVCAVALGLWWFHPLSYIAASRFRYDQELACDAIVLAKHPQFKRVYADALLKISSHFQAGLIHCHFPHQPFRKRIMEIFKAEKSNSTRTFGHLFIATLIGLSSYAAWASNVTQDTTNKNQVTHAEQTNPQAYMLVTKIDVGDQTTSPRILVKEGQAAKIAVDLQGAHWEISFLVTQKSPSANKKKLDIKITASKNQEEIANATLWLGINEPGAVQIATPEKNLKFNLQLTPSKPTT